MKTSLPLLFVSLCFAACSPKTENNATEKDKPAIEGTWQLISGTLIEKGDTTVTDHTKGEKMIKIINGDHFAFLRHDLHQGKDSADVYSSGGGKYTLEGDQYTEYLEFCSERAWENNNFKFSVSVKNDTLIQSGVEKIENLGVERLNIEKYVRLK